MFIELAYSYLHIDLKAYKVYSNFMEVLVNIREKKEYGTPMTVQYLHHIHEALRAKPNFEGKLARWFPEHAKNKISAMEQVL